MPSKIPIYICSSRRAPKIGRLFNICADTGRPVFLVVPRAEIKSYLAALGTRRNVLFLSQKRGRLPEANQIALEHAAFSQGARAMIMIDDDARFRSRCLLDASLDEMGVEGHEHMFKSLTNFPPGVALQGVQQYFMHHLKNGLFQECCAQGTLQAINLEMVDPNKIRFDRVPTYQDTDFVLQIARAGFRNRLLNQYVVSTSDSWAGGCDYRTVDTWNDAIKQLEKLWGPELVHVRQKTIRRKRVIRSVSKTCTEVDMLTLSVNWKKAFQC